jgi:hypothetical protein
MGQGDVPMKNREARRLGGARAHQSRRIWPAEFACAAKFSEGFCNDLATNLRRGKGRRGRMPGAI